MFKKLLQGAKDKAGLAAVVALVVGVVSELTGVDIAPTVVDAIVTLVASSLAVWEAWKASKAKPAA